jgi:hypothetical protein
MSGTTLQGIKPASSPASAFHPFLPLAGMAAFDPLQTLWFDRIIAE